MNKVQKTMFTHNYLTLAGVTYVSAYKVTLIKVYNSFS